MADTDLRALVIDNGSEMIKAGFAGEDMPCVIFTTVVGRPRHQVLQLKDNYIGEEALSKRSILSLTYPIENGTVTSWDDMETIWNYTICSRLRKEPTAQPILLTDSSNLPKGHREKMTEIMFEKLNVPSLYIEKQTQLSLYSSGRPTGVVYYSGEGVTQTESFHSWAPCSDTATTSNIAGRQIDNYLMDLLKEKDHNSNSTTTKETVRIAKEKLCYVALDFEKEMCSDVQEKSFELPDGQIIKLNNERFQCTEMLFRSSLLDGKFLGIQEYINGSIMKSGIDLRTELYANIVLSGGSTLFPGIVERIEKELKSIIPPNTNVNIYSSFERKFHPWLGGSLLASIPKFASKALTKKKYDECGPSVVQQKFS